MTDRLRTLMHDEADHLQVPPVPADAVLAAGRRIRRNRRLVAGSSALAVAVVAGVGTLAVLDRVDRGPEHPPVASYSAAYDVVYAAGSTVVVDDERATVRGTVHDMVYTSVGALVRSNRHGGISDGSGPETLTLVRPDGSTVALGTIPEGVGPATDPRQPYYALAEKERDGFVAVVRDAESGDEVARVALPDQPRSYWAVPPLTLAGDVLHVGYRSTVWAVDWRTGDAEEVEGQPGGIPATSSGRRVVGGDGSPIRVIDVATDEEVYSTPMEGFGDGELSPDGRSLLVTFEEGEGSSTLHDVASGRSLELPAPEDMGWGWTGSGRAVTIGPDGLTVCGVDGCEEKSLAAGTSGDVKPGGERYES